MTDSMPTISLIWIGHVDHGKSTTLGHLLSQIGAIDPRTVEKLREDASHNQMESWQWAYVLDSLPEEQQRGITADIAFFPFTTDKRNFMLIDAPGHRDFVKNMIRGASQADACVLVVSAVPNDLTSGLKNGSYQDPGGQTREHALLASVLGIQEIVVAINKMDQVNYSKDRYQEAVELMKNLFQEIKSTWVSKIDDIPFIPISGYLGDNLTISSQNMDWYSGPTLLETLNSLQGTELKKGLPMRFVTYDLDERHGFGTLLLGKVLGAPISVGDKITILPQGEPTEVKELWIQENKIPLINPGEHGSILLKNIDKDLLEEGVVLTPVQSDYQFASTIQAKLLILEGSFVPGSSVIFHCGTSYSTAQISQILEISVKNPKHKKLPREFEGRITIAFESELILAELSLDSSIVVEKYSDFPELGRVILRHSGQTIAVGIVTEIEKK
ncbi:MAG: GTP-binding protein [Candidatus Hodarchaeales archaeon]